MLTNEKFKSFLRKKYTVLADMTALDPTQTDSLLNEWYESHKDNLNYIHKIQDCRSEIFDLKNQTEDAKSQIKREGLYGIAIGMVLGSVLTSFIVLLLNS